MKNKGSKSSSLSKPEYGEPCPCELSPPSPDPPSREGQDTILGLIAR
jgi:hypothetical protein